jgi:hypothetical protein
LVVGLALTACGFISGPGPVEDCPDLLPVEVPGGWRIGPALVTASCVEQVEVGGRTYAVGPGDWLDDEVEPIEFAQITRSNGSVFEPVAYALPGVEPPQFLVMKDDVVDGADDPGGWIALSGVEEGFPDGLCRYFDPDDPQLPDECRAED